MAPFGVSVAVAALVVLVDTQLNASSIVFSFSVISLDWKITWIEVIRWKKYVCNL